MTNQAVEATTQLGDIKFPEFTANLIGSTFDALISANLRQMTAYAELVDTLGESITTFINNTKDDITIDETLAFLEKVLPAYESDEPEKATRVTIGTSLTKSEAVRLTTALKLPVEATIEPEDPENGQDALTQTTVAEGKITQATLTPIIKAVAARLACNKYNLLQNMVNQGLLRLVVESGVIETSLKFEVKEEKSYSYDRSSYFNETVNKKKAGNRGLFGTLLFGSKNTTASSQSLYVSRSSVGVANDLTTDINITGGVRLNFKTDYLPLNIEKDAEE